MRFEWDMYHMYDDGSQSTWCRFKVFNDAGKEITHGHIDDHTLPKAKEDDRKCNRDVYYAYSISESYDWIRKTVLQEVFEEHGFAEEDHGVSGFDDYGICANEDYRKSPFEYVGTPKCTIHDVVDMVEEAFCRSLYFDYDAELAEAKRRLDERKARMDEAKVYLYNKAERKKEMEREYAAEFQNSLEV